MTLRTVENTLHMLIESMQKKYGLLVDLGLVKRVATELVEQRIESEVYARIEGLSIDALAELIGIVDRAEKESARVKHVETVGVTKKRRGRPATKKVEGH